MRKSKIISAATPETVTNNLNKFMADELVVVESIHYSTNAKKDKTEYSVLVIYNEKQYSFKDNPKQILG